MKKVLCIFVFLFGFTSVVLAQQTINGRAVDSKSGESLIGAYVTLNAADTVGIHKQGRIVVTDIDGNFKLVSGYKKSDITISYVGYRTTKVDVLEGQVTVELGTIKVDEQAVAANTVTVVGQVKMAKVDGDTVQYNAAAFKTNPDATAEDLLKKMPGVTTNESGQVESQGQVIAKVLVNGKEFFDDDPSLALRTLPSESVENVQMYDDQSEESKFSGFDDGQRVRTINIVTKKGVMNSSFGKVYGGYGTDGRYSAGAGVNIWRDAHRWTVIAQTNNVNNQGFTLNDISQGSSGMRRGRMGGGSGDVGSFTTSARGGIMQTNMVGLNYNGQFDDKWKLSGSYFFNGRSADQMGTRAQDYLTMPRYYQQATSSLGYEYQHRFNARAEWTPNDNNKITFSPRINYSLNHGGSSNIARTSESYGGLLTNAADNYYDTKLESYNLSGDLWWQHRFDKAGRTMSFGAVATGRKNWGYRYQNSLYGSLDDASEWVPDSLKQYGLLDGSSYSVTGSFTYNEPLSKRSRLSANYTINYDRSISDRQGLNWDKQMQDYTLLDTTTTNHFSRNYTTHVAGIGYNYNIDKKFTLSASINYQYATLGNNQEFPVIANSDKRYSFAAWQPTLRMTFNPSKEHSLNFSYHASSSFPSMNQLQDVLDVTNILQVSSGNSSLKQSYNNSFSLRYNYANTEKNINFNIFANATQTSNYIANHRRFLTEQMVVDGTTIPKGAQYTSPENLNGYFNAGLYSTLAVGVKPIKSNINLSVYYRFVQSPSIEDFVEYLSHSNVVGARLSLTSNFSEKIDFTLSYDPSVRLSNAGTGRFDRYYAHNATIFMNLFIWQGLFVNADASWRNTFGTQSTYSEHFALLNAAIGYKFLNNKFDVRVAGYDLLEQNRSTRQSTTDTYTQITTSNVLQRYFMVSLTWKFDTRKGKNSLTDSGKPLNDGRGMMMMRQH